MPKHLTYNEVRRYVDSMKADRKDKMREIGLNREWYIATNERHYDSYYESNDGRIRRVRREPDRPDEVRWTNDLMKSLINKVTSAVGQTPVRYYGVPKTRDLEHRASANMTTMFLQHLFFGDKPTPLSRLRRKVAMKAQIDGVVFLKSGFDPFGGDPTEIPSDVANELPEAERQKHTHTGASWTSIVTADQLIYPRWIDNLSKAPAIVEERYVTLGELMKRFPRNPKIRQAVRKSGAGMSQLDSFTSRRMHDDAFSKHMFLTWEVWVPAGAAWRPSAGAKSNSIRVFNRGLFQFWVEGILEPISSMEVPHSSLGIDQPYDPIAYSEHPESDALDGIPFASDLRAKVPYLEALVNSYIERELIAGDPVLFMPSGAVNVKKFMERRPGEPVEWNHRIGHPPQYIVPAWNQAMAIQLISELSESVMQESGVRDVAQGGVPKRAESGIAIQTAIEDNLSRMNNYHVTVDEGFTDTQWKRVVMESNWSIGTRHLGIFSRTQLMDIVDWEGQSMTGTARVHTVSSPTIHYSPAREEMKVMQSLQAGLISMEEAQDRMTLPPADGQGFGMRAEHSAIARHENRLIMDGRVEEAETFDEYNHSVHAYVHMQHFLQHRWDMTDEQREALQKHIEEHQTKEIMAMIGQAQVMTLGQNPEALAAGATQ